MSEPIVVAPNAGEVIGDAPDRRVEILSDHESLNATWSRFAAGREGADLHVHRQHHDLFYVLDGEFTLRLGLEDEQVRLPAGTLARMPPMVVHGFRNASDAEVRYLNLHAPGRRFADYLRALRDGRDFSYDQFPPPADGVRSPADAVVGGEVAVHEAPALRVRLLADVEEIAVAEVDVQPGRDWALRPAGVESLYVLEGEAAIAAASGEIRAGVGTWVQLPAGAERSVAAVGPDPVRLLDVHTPGAGAAGVLHVM